MRRDLGRMTTTYNFVPGYVFLFELFDEAKKTGTPDVNCDYPIVSEATPDGGNRDYTIYSGKDSGQGKSTVPNSRQRCPHSTVCDTTTWPYIDGL